MSVINETPRQAGKRGLRRVVHHPEMMLPLFRETSPAPPPPTGDVTHGITDWGMDSNDRHSCCGPAATDHYQVSKSGDISQINQLGGVGVLPLYYEYGKSQGETGNEPDEGVDNPSWLQFLFGKGIIEAWAEIDHSDVNEVHAAMNNFSGVLVSVSLTDDAENLFAQKLPWTTDNGEHPNPQEGHDILLAKYDESGDTFVTWGALQGSTIKWDSSCITGAFVIVTSDDAQRNGVDINALKEQCRALGGESSNDSPVLPITPSVIPPVTPEVIPTPDPLDEGDA